MHFIRLVFVFAAAALLGTSPLLAARLSPHETISSVIDKNRVTIVYGRPYSKDPKTGETRKIWGTLVPYGKPWRTGADEATLFITEHPLAFGDVTIPAGAYTLFTSPTATGGTLIFNKELGQWGLHYDPTQDFATVELKVSPLDHSVDQFTIALDKNPAGGGTIKLMWENTQYSADYTLKK